MADLHAEIDGILSSTEGIIMCLKQSSLSALAPTFIIITDTNVITVHFSFWHYYAGFRLWGFTRSTYKCMIPYRNITAATLVKGNIFSTLELKTKDIEHSEKRGGIKDTVAIDGLFTEHAERLVKIIDLFIMAHQFPPPIADPEKISLERAIEACKKGKKIIWFGFEDKETVASALSIPASQIVAIRMADFFDLPLDDLKKLQNCIILGYTTNSASVIGKVLELEAQLKCTIIDGGLVNNVPKDTTFIRSSILARSRDDKKMIPLENRHGKQKYMYTVSE